MAASATSQHDVHRVLQDTFGLSSFRPGQQAVIDRLLAGKSAAAIFPTGGGKSLCYQLPAVLLEGLTVVVSPLLALMREQVDALQRRGIAAARLDSSLSADQARETLEQIRQGQVKLLYVAPERFFNERFRELLGEVSIALFAIDEAHCISQWGHNFRPDYLKLARLARQLQVQRVLALTATATPGVLEDIRREFDIAPADAVLTPFYRSNLTLRFTLSRPQERDELLIRRLRDNPAGPSLVYVSLQKTAEQVAERLTAAGFDARCYHAGLDDEVRRQTQDWFMACQQGIVVATIAFGMGVDKSNIRSIYHYNPSKSLENLAQEIGRAGRDGQPAICETLLVPEDRIVLENFAYGDTPSLASIEQLVEFLIGQPEQFFVSYYSLAYETDIRDLVIRTLFTHLELQDILLATAPRYESYKFKPLVPSSEILKHFEGERRQFAASVLTLTVKRRVWFEISLPQVSARLGCDRSRIVRMLDYFAERGWIELNASGLVFGYRKLQSIGDPQALAQELYQVALEREIGELTRLEELFSLMAADGCQSAALAQHFGQSLPDDCGHCSVCQGAAMGEIPEPDYPQVGDSALTGLRQLCQQHPDVLADARGRARFLCGLSSPRLIRARLTAHPLYGCCAGVPFDHVLQAVVGRP